MSAPAIVRIRAASGARRRTRRTSRDRTARGTRRTCRGCAVRGPWPLACARAFMMCTVRETILFANVPRGIRAAPVCVFSTSQNIPIPEPIRAKRIRSRVGARRVALATSAPAHHLDATTRPPPFVWPSHAANRGPHCETCAVPGCAPAATYARTSTLPFHRVRIARPRRAPSSPASDDVRWSRHNSPKHTLAPETLQPTVGSHDRAYPSDAAAPTVASAAAFFSLDTTSLVSISFTGVFSHEEPKRHTS